MDEQQLQQKYKNSLAALDAAHQHGMPDLDYQKAVMNLNVSHQEQLVQSAEQGELFVRGLTATPSAVPAAQSSDAQRLSDLLYAMQVGNAPSAAVHQTQNALATQTDYDQKKQAILSDNALDSWEKDIRLEDLDKQYRKTQQRPSAVLAVSPSPSPSGPTYTAGPIQPPSVLPTQPPVHQPAAPEPGPAPPLMFPDVPDDYQNQRQAIISNTSMDSWEKNAALQKLDAAFGKTQLAQVSPDPNAAKLDLVTDQLSALDIDISYMRQYGATVDQLEPYYDKVTALKKQRGALQGLDKIGYGYGVDPSKVVDIKLTNADVGNAQYNNGKLTGNLEDAVKGLGGRIDWYGGNSAVIKDAGGHTVSIITILGDKVYEKDSNGYIINSYEVQNGQVQADIGRLADQMGVPLSYYHDENGAYHAYAQPEMRNAPIKVVRRDDQVIIDAYICIDTTDPTKAQQTIDAIDKVWDTGAAFDISGIDASGKPLGKEPVYLKVNIHAIDRNGTSYGGGIPKGQNASVINFDPNRSHVYTTSNPIELFKNLGDALSTGEYEKVMYDWKINDPGNMWISKPDDAAHEFGHLLGLGDAYGKNGGFYRLFRDAPKNMDQSSGNGQTVKLEVPDTDLMRCGNGTTMALSSADVLMLLQATRYNQPQYFEKEETKESDAQFDLFLLQKMGLISQDNADQILVQFNQPPYSPRVPSTPVSTSSPNITP